MKLARNFLLNYDTKFILVKEQKPFARYAVNSHRSHPCTSVLDLPNSVALVGCGMTAVEFSIFCCSCSSMWGLFETTRIFLQLAPTDKNNIQRRRAIMMGRRFHCLCYAFSSNTRELISKLYVRCMLLLQLSENVLPQYATHYLLPFRLRFPEIPEKPNLFYYPLFLCIVLKFSITDFLF